MFPSEQDWPHLKDRLSPPTRDLVLELAVGLSHQVPGEIMEFGVASGRSTSAIRRAVTRLERRQRTGPTKRIFGCDSFEGLTEAYENAPAGTFAQDPPKIRGVEMVVGFFDDTLTPELAARIGKVAFASLDADLYSSTLTALRWLTPLLGTGSLLLFDEYLGEGASEQRAHEDWLAETGVRTVTVAEFARPPAGWGDTPDKRVLAQVIGDEQFTPVPVTYWPTARYIANGLRHRARKLTRR